MEALKASLARTSKPRRKRPRARRKVVVKLLAGTSGYAFKEWKGAFYPEDLKDDGMLGYYASKFPTVEINNTFYRLPKENVLREWAAQVPEHFTFAIKASQRITHYARLKPDCADTVDYLLRNTAMLGDRLGPILFQLPPNMKKDIAAPRGFLGLLPSDRRFTIRVPPRELVRRGRLRPPSASTMSRCAWPSRRSSSVPCTRRRRGGTCGCIGQTTTMGR